MRKPAPRAAPDRRPPDGTTPRAGDLRDTRIVKTLWPASPGTQALLQQHGERLVCVRYRHGDGGIVRYTTVELVVGEARVRVRPAPARLYGVRIFWQETRLTRLAKAAGATWDAASDLWNMRGETVLQLGLGHRIRRR